MTRILSIEIPTWYNLAPFLPRAPSDVLFFSRLKQGLLQKVINTLGTVLTFNFFIIIIFFTWFITGVGAQFALDNVEIINAFRGAWDVIILPLLTTHMTLTFLSYGLEKMAKSDA